MENTGDAFCKAVDIIVKRRMEQADTPKIIKCKISSIKNINSGEYGVAYQGNTLTVYAISPLIEYALGDNVYILLPDGDISKTKIIVGADAPPKVKESLSTTTVEQSSADLVPITSAQIKKIFESL